MGKSRPVMSGLQLDPNGRVVAGLLPTPNRAVDLGSDQARSQLRAEQQVINPEASIATPGVSEVVPEGVNGLAGMLVTQGIAPAVREQL